MDRIEGEHAPLVGVAANGGGPLTSSERPMAYMFALIHMSIGFLLAFSAFNSVSAIVSSIVPNDLGYYSLAVLYACFCGGAVLLAPVVSMVLPAKWGTTLGSITYSVYVASILVGSRWYFILPAAGLLGLGASVLWTSQGQMLTAFARGYASAQNKPVSSALGTFNGIFFCIFQLAQVLGNIMSSVLLHIDGKGHLLIYVGLGVGVLGTLVLACVRVPAESTADAEASAKKAAAGKNAGGVIRNVLNCFSMLREGALLLLIPTIFYSGFESSFSSGIWTAKVIKESGFGTQNIGYVMSVYGGVNALSSVLLGYLADTAQGKKLVLVIGAMAQLVFYQFFVWMLNFHALGYFKENAWQLFIAGGVYGIGDAAFNLVPSALLGMLFSSRVDVAFSHLKLWQSLGAVSVLLLGPRLAFIPLCIIAVCVLLASSISVAVLNLFVAPIDQHNPKEDSATVN